MSDDYDTKVLRSFFPAEIAHIAAQASALRNVDAWDGEVVLERNGIILGVLWFNGEVEEWCFDPTRHGERT